MKHFSLDHSAALYPFYYYAIGKNYDVCANYVWVIMSEGACGSNFPASFSKWELLNFSSLWPSEDACRDGTISTLEVAKDGGGESAQWRLGTQRVRNLDPTCETPHRALSGLGKQMSLSPAGGRGNIKSWQTEASTVKQNFVEV